MELIGESWSSDPVNHPISACKRIPNLAHIYIIGFYEEGEFALYVSSVSNELRVPTRYLKEDRPHGSAGGLCNIRDLIMEDNPVLILICSGVAFRRKKSHFSIYIYVCVTLY